MSAAGLSCVELDQRLHSLVVVQQCAPPVVGLQARGVPPILLQLLQRRLRAVRRALEDGAETLRRLAPPPSAGPLDRFRAAFTERYGTRWVPLLEALDEESGIGFDGAPPLEGALLEGLPLQPSAPPQPLAQRDRFLLAQLPRWQGALTWELTDADVEALANPEPQPFPASFAALTSLAAASPAALDRGEAELLVVFPADLTRSVKRGERAQVAVDERRAVSSFADALADLAFTLAIDAVGQIAGTVTEAETSRTAPVTGRLIDWEFPCSSDKTLIEVEFSFESEALRKLSGSRAKGFVQPWPFQVEYELGLSRIGGGVLTLAKQ